MIFMDFDCRIAQIQYSEKNDDPVILYSLFSASKNLVAYVAVLHS